VPALAVIGHLSRDVVEGAEPRIGGGPWYAGRALQRLARPALVGAKCGEADADAFRTRLVTLGLPLTLVRAGETTAFSFAYEGDVRAMQVDAVGDPWTPAEAVAAAGDAEWVHAAPLLRSDFPPETLAALAEGRQVLLDAQGLVRVAQTGPLTLDDRFEPALLDGIAILKLAAEEAAVLAPLDRLTVPEIVVTLGSEGCVVHFEGREEHVPAQAVRAGIDPTGAGDAFAVSYLAARADGHAPAAAARAASSLVAELLES
jgi:sugar/nucleoside kinase (ribokinase family)